MTAASRSTPKPRPPRVSRRTVLRRFSARLYLAFGLSAIALSIVLAASWLGLWPDPDEQVRLRRASLAEQFAITTSVLAETADAQVLEGTLKLMRSRAPELLSIGLRGQDGRLWMELGEHAAHWTPAPSGHSTEEAISVPVWREGATWGQVELRFAALRPAGWQGWLHDPVLRTGAYVFAASFLAYFLYLRRMLRHLDPSRAVPARVRHALDSLTEGLLVLDARGVIMLANQSLGAVLGRSSDDLVGHPAAGIAWTGRDGQPLPQAELPWQRALDEAQVQRHRLVYVDNARGERSSFRTNSSPIFGPDDTLQGVLVSLQDVTELEEKEEALQEAKDEAEAANRTKSEFLANMSHEIRTPMNAILGFTDVLRRGGLREGAQAHRHLDVIHASGHHLLNLINDILDLSKVESGRLETERIAYAPHRVMHEVVQTLEVRAREKGIALSLDFPEPLPGSLCGDPARLRQILTNLVGNAIKFTDRGRVALRARCPRGEGPAVYAIDIEDTGVGIPADKLDSIFEPFVQAEASTARRFGGTGLGLTISRGLARAMGGDITVRSTLGQGTTFSLRLEAGPLRAEELLAPAQLRESVDRVQRPEPVRWRFPPRRVLVVDDALENRELARVLLEDAGLSVLEAENGALALEAVAREPVDLILMDMQMPVMDGSTATRTLRERGCRLPILALTANAMKGFELEIEAAGFSGFHTKPIDIDALLADLAGRLGGQRAEPAPDGALPTEDEDTPILELSSAERDEAEDAVSSGPLHSTLAGHPRLGGLAQRFASGLPAKLDQMQAALDAKDGPALAALAHWLKGTGGSMGYEALIDPCVQLEAAAKGSEFVRAGAALARLRALSLRMQPAATPP